MELKDLASRAAIVVIGFVAGCASIPLFPYKWYGLDAVRYDGSLRGPTPQDDLNLKLCDPEAQPSPAPSHSPDKGLCVVMLRSEFFKLKGDHESCEQSLSNCQQGGGH